MLTGHRLFFGDTDYQTVELVQKANIPRLAPLNPEVDRASSSAGARARARSEGALPDRRDLGDALADYLFSHRMKVTAYTWRTCANPHQRRGAGAGEEQSLIDRLIQEELDESVGIGSQSGSLPVQNAAGNVQLRAGESYEDPASWFSDDNDLLGDAIRSFGGSGHGQLHQSGSWREGGIRTRRSRARTPPPAKAPRRKTRSRSKCTSSTTRRGRCGRSRGAAPGHAERGRPGRAESECGAYVLFALLAAAAGAVAFFGSRLM